MLAYNNALESVSIPGPGGSCASSHFDPLYGVWVCDEWDPGVSSFGSGTVETEEAKSIRETAKKLGCAWAQQKG
jgi:hypothetical protein